MLTAPSIRSNWRIDPARGRVIAFWTARAALLLWSAFWLWFNIASMIGERTGWQHHLKLAVITLGLTVIAWFWPRIGGALLVLAAVLGASLFPNIWALTLLALPAAAVGVLLLLAGRAN